MEDLKVKVNSDREVGLKILDSLNDSNLRTFTINSVHLSHDEFYHRQN